MAQAYDEVGALCNNTGCNKARMIQHIYHDSPLLACGGLWRKSAAWNQGSCACQCFDSGRAARSGASHYLHISSVKLIVFAASLHEPTCHPNLACGRHSSVRSLVWEKWAPFVKRGCSQIKKRVGLQRNNSMKTTEFR